MKIAQVVTLVSPDGAFGGPLRVAVNQCKALQELGDDPVIFAGIRGYDTPPTNIEGVELRSFPVRSLVPGTGFAGMVAPGLNRQLKDSLDDFDVVHVHIARDLVTLPAARVAQKAGKRYVLQPHGMIDPSRRLLAKPLDALLTRPVFRGASAVFHLNEKDRAGIVDAIGGDMPFEHVQNGVPTQTEVRPEERSGPLEVLFLARLQERKRPMIFVELAIALAAQHPNVKFTLVGPDEGEGSTVSLAIEASRFADQIEWVGALPPSETIQRMRKASIYVLPSINEPFPMSVLEAMSVGLAIVVTESNGLASMLRDLDAGIVSDGSVNDLVEIVGRLIDTHAERNALGDRARSAVDDHLSIGSVARQLSAAYQAP